MFTLTHGYFGEVDVAMRLHALFLFVATCVCWAWPDPELDRLDEMVAWLLSPDCGLHDVIKEWHVDCKKRTGSSLAFGVGLGYFRALCTS